MCIPGEMVSGCLMGARHLIEVKNNRRTLIGTLVTGHLIQGVGCGFLGSTVWLYMYLPRQHTQSRLVVYISPLTLTLAK